MALIPIGYISKIQLPGGGEYLLKDTEARQLISELQSATDFLGVTTTELTDQSTTNPITIGNKSVTATNGNMAVYEQKEFIFDGTKWYEFGDLSSLGALAYKSSVTLNKGTSTTVLKSDVTATAASSAVSFSGGATDKVLGSDATFTTTVTPSTAVIKATATGGTVGASGTDTFVKSYPGATSKLVTTSVPNVTANDNVTIPNVTSAGTASTWSFTMGSGTDEETLIIQGSNSTIPTLGTALSASKVTLGSDITCATGALSGSGGGSVVLTGLGTPTTGSAVTGVSVTAQPTVSLSTADLAGEGMVTVATGITSATTSTNNKDEVTAVTSVGSATAAAQNITINTSGHTVGVAPYSSLSITVND